MLTMTNDNNIASKFKVTIHILFVFGRIIVLIIDIRPNSKDPLFGTALVSTYSEVLVRYSTGDSLVELGGRVSGAVLEAGLTAEDLGDKTHS